MPRRKKTEINSAIPIIKDKKETNHKKEKKVKSVKKDKKELQDSVVEPENHIDKLIVNLPIKVNKKSMDSSEVAELKRHIKDLNDENINLRDKLNKMMKDTNGIRVIKNNTNKNKNNLKCIYCSGNIENGKGLIIPDKIKNTNYLGIGRVCSFSCMSSYNFRIINDEKVWDRHALINKMKDEISPHIKEIRMAPPIEVMKEYGGELSREEFDSHLDKPLETDTFIKLTHPLSSTEIIIEQRRKTNNMTHLSMLTGGDTILKRRKPVKTSHYTLDNIISNNIDI